RRGRPAPPGGWHRPRSPDGAARRRPWASRTCTHLPDAPSRSAGTRGGGLPRDSAGEERKVPGPRNEWRVTRQRTRGRAGIEWRVSHTSGESGWRTPLSPAAHTPRGAVRLRARPTIGRRASPTPAPRRAAPACGAGRAPRGAGPRAARLRGRPRPGPAGAGPVERGARNEPVHAADRPLGRAVVHPRGRAGLRLRGAPAQRGRALQPGLLPAAAVAGAAGGGGLP